MKAIRILIAALLFTGPITVPVAADNIEKQIEQGKGLMKSGDFKKSAELFNQLLTQKKDEVKNHPRLAESWYLFSLSLRKIGRVDLADKALERAKKLKEAAQKGKEAVAATNNETSGDFSEPATTTTTTAIASETGKAGDESNVYDLASLKTAKAKDHHRKGAALHESGQLQAAADEFLLAIAAEPGNTELLSKTAIILDQIGSSYYLKGQQVFAELEKTDAGKMTHRLKAAQARANIYSARPDLKKAETILQSLLKDSPDNIEALILSAQLDSENKNYQSAIEKFAGVIKLDKNNMAAYLGSGDSYQKMKQFPKAIEILQQARALWPDNFMPLVSLGNAYLKNSDNGLALVMFNLAYEMNQESFEVNLGLLEIFARKGDYRANLHINKCEKVFRGDPRVEYYKAIFAELDERPDEARKIYSLLAMYQDDIAYRAKLRIGQLYAGIGHQTFPGDILIADRPRFERVYQKMLDQELAFAYLQEFLEKRSDAPEAKSVRDWLDENEETLRNAREFDSLIQSQFSSN